MSDTIALIFLSTIVVLDSCWSLFLMTVYGPAVWSLVRVTGLCDEVSSLESILWKTSAAVRHGPTSCACFTATGFEVRKFGKRKCPGPKYVTVDACIDMTWQGSKGCCYGYKAVETQNLQPWPACTCLAKHSNVKCVGLFTPGQALQVRSWVRGTRRWRLQNLVEPAESVSELERPRQPTGS